MPPPAKSNIYFDLLEALQQSDCPVCRLVDRDVRQYIDGFFYESLTVVERRAEIRAARGFCSVHGSILSGNSRTLGTAIIHHDVINDVLRGFPGGAGTPGRGGIGGALTGALSGARDAVAKALRPQRECVLCSHERHQERIALETLAKELDDERLREAFARSNGVCLPHMQVAVQLKSVKETDIRRLIELQRAIMERVRGELETFIHKSNGSYEFVAMGEEATSPARATRMVSGRVFGRR